MLTAMKEDKNLWYNRGENFSRTFSFKTEAEGKIWGSLVGDYETLGCKVKNQPYKKKNQEKSVMVVWVYDCHAKVCHVRNLKKYVWNWNWSVIFGVFSSRRDISVMPLRCCGRGLGRELCDLTNSERVLQSERKRVTEQAREFLSILRD